jgi:hypothetical protein
LEEKSIFVSLVRLLKHEMGCLVLLPWVEMPHILFIYLDEEKQENCWKVLYCSLTLSDMVQIVKEKTGRCCHPEKTHKTVLLLEHRKMEPLPWHQPKNNKMFKLVSFHQTSLGTVIGNIANTNSLQASFERDLTAWSKNEHSGQRGAV